LQGTGWCRDSAWAGISWASSRGIALWGAHGTFNAGDGDVNFTGLATSWLEWIFEVACACFAVVVVKRTCRKKEKEKENVSFFILFIRVNSQKQNKKLEMNIE
jgi:hypothetical protein